LRARPATAYARRRTLEGNAMFKEFRAFVMRGNVLDLAVAVIIGAAFGSIVTSMTDDLIMPVIGALTGGVDFSSQFVGLAAVPEGYAGPLTYTELKKAGVPTFGWGAFATALVKFLILAFVIFQLVKLANRLPWLGVASGGSAVPDDVRLLTEIRDELKARPRLPGELGPCAT
jgi:large conductance mechanosensitive channel